MKKININPVGLKGKEINERIKELMGKPMINEDLRRSVVELTKMGPDGKIYGVVRENHEYYIKVTNKQNDLVTEDFNYIGGLQNKKSQAYPTYAKAIKQLNLTFKSLAEAYGTNSDINIFVNDRLLKECGGNMADSGLYEEEDVDANGLPIMMAEEEIFEEEEVELSEDEIAIDEMIAEMEENDGIADNSDDYATGDEIKKKKD